ncbi:MAG: D-aminoacyl-tRNA deacylase [Elusimicrobiales bacterium]
MISVVQRVISGSVCVEGNVYSEIKKGFVILCGFSKNDTHSDLLWSANKIINLRVFENREGRFDLSIKDIDGEILVVSQFTLLGDVRKGRRPDFTMAMEKEKAREYYDAFISILSNLYNPAKIKRGIFQADMLVSIMNDGPVTVIIDSKLR